MDFLTKKRVKNKGQAQQYYVEDSHSAIISKEMFMQVQEEMKRRSNIRKQNKNKSRFTSIYPFLGITCCGKCGMPFRRRRWGTKPKYYQYVWICKARDDNGPEACSMPAVHEEKLKKVFVRAINKAISDKKEFTKKIINNVEKVVPKYQENLSMDEVQERLKELQQELMKLVRINVNTGLDSEIYDGKYARIAKEIESLREKKQTIQETKLDDTIRKNRAA